MCVIGRRYQSAMSMIYISLHLYIPYIHIYIYMNMFLYIEQSALQCRCVLESKSDTDTSIRTRVFAYTNVCIHIYIQILCWSALLHCCALELQSDTAGQSIFIMQVLQAKQMHCPMARLKLSRESLPHCHGPPLIKAWIREITCEGKKMCVFTLR